MPDAVADRLLISMTEAGSLCGVRASTISDLVTRLGIEVKPLPRNGKGKGLDRGDLRRIKKALGIGRGRSAGHP